MGLVLQEDTVLTGQEILDLRKKRQFGVMRHEDFSGIYCIKNLVNGKVYIGSRSRKKGGIKHRWADHVFGLSSNSHGNDHLQNSWNKYGPQNFQFSVIEKIEDDYSEQTSLHIKKREEYYFEYFNVFKNGYNMDRSAKGGGYRMTEKLIEQGKSKQLNISQFTEIKTLLTTTDMPLQEISKKVGVKRGVVKSIYNRTFLVEDCKDLVFQKRGPNISKITSEQWKEIEEQYKNRSSLDELGRQYNVGPDSLKKYLKQYGVEIIRNVHRLQINEIAVYQYDLSGKYIQKYDSTKKAAESLGITTDIKIIRVCKGKKRTAYGYRWSYQFTEDLRLNNIYEEIFEKPLEGRLKPIIEYDLNWKPRNIYESIRKAAKAHNGNITQIRYHMNVAIDKQTYESYWKYAEDAPQEDLQYLLQLKQEQQNSSHQVDE